MPVIRVEGGEIEVTERGSGRPLVLLHSLLTDIGAWDAVAPFLAERRRVIALNLPGFGASSPAGATIEGVADRVAKLFPALNLPPESDVLGNGFGGFVASALAIRHGRLFERLVLADTGLVFPPEGKEAFHVMAARVREHGMSGVVEIALKRLFPDEFIAANPAVAASCRAALRRADPDLFASACLALAALDLRPRAREIRNATLVLVGTLDSATPPPMAHELARAIPAAHLVELDGCGHAPQLQMPERFVAAVASFLDPGARRLDAAAELPRVAPA